MTRQTSSNWFWDKVMPSLMVAACIGSASAAWSMYKTSEDLKRMLAVQDSRLQQQDERLGQIETRLSKSEGDIVQIRGQMIGWDVLKRIELALSALAQQGNGDRGMRAMSQAIGAEIAARKEQR